MVREGGLRLGERTVRLQSREAWVALFNCRVSQAFFFRLYDASPAAPAPVTINIPCASVLSFITSRSLGSV